MTKRENLKDGGKRSSKQRDWERRDKGQICEGSTQMPSYHAGYTRRKSLIASQRQNREKESHIRSIGPQNNDRVRAVHCTVRFPLFIHKSSKI